jgi:O-acetyl-ADP-ribose deacetylase (regulator of RNase III)
MIKTATQEQRLDYLVEAFKADAVEYQDLRTPADTESRQRLLRSLMNVRMPRPMAKDILLVQDEYLKERAEERGIVPLARIPSIAESLGSNRPFADTLSLWQGDITCLAVDAIVNAANSQMLGCFQPCHSCIDNCIHSYAGIQLRAECHRQMQVLRSRYGREYEQPTAVPMLTDGYNLPAKKVVHIVGPIVYDGLTPKLESDLADCYRNTLDLCAENGLRSVAFCSISTGVFRFPKERAAEIAVRTVTDWLAAHPGRMDRVIFNVFSDRDRCNYEQKLR